MGVLSSLQDYRDRISSCKGSSNVNIQIPKEIVGHDPCESAVEPRDRKFLRVPSVISILLLVLFRSVADDGAKKAGKTPV
jgi:hypothetical protein